MVSESKYEQAVKEQKTCKDELGSVTTELTALKEKLPALEKQLEDERKAASGQAEELDQQRAIMNEQLEAFQKLTAKFEDMVATDDIQVEVRRGRMLVALPSNVLFDSGKAELSPRGQKTLGRVATKLKELGTQRLIVAGHTDNEPIKQSAFADNWELSTVRALKVTRFLIEQGIDPQNLAAAGYGEFDPAGSNRNERGKQRNRRIELIVEPKIPDFTKLIKDTKKVVGKLGAPGEGDAGKAAEAAPEGKPATEAGKK